MINREFERFIPPATIQVQDVVTEQLIGVIGNISAGGIMLVAHSEIDEGNLYQFRLSIEKNITPMLDISIGTCCYWQQKLSDQGSYWAGMHIIDISDQDRLKLKQYLDAIV